MSESQEQELLQYKNGYWTGYDGDLHLELPNALLSKHYLADLSEQEIAPYTEEDAGRRAEAFQACCKPSYWRGVKHPAIRRTGKDRTQEDSGEQAD